MNVAGGVFVLGSSTKGVSFSISFSGDMANFEGKLGEEFNPTELAAGKVLSFCEVQQIGVVRQNEKR